MDRSPARGIFELPDLEYRAFVARWKHNNTPEPPNHEFFEDSPMNQIPMYSTMGNNAARQPHDGFLDPFQENQMDRSHPCGNTIELPDPATYLNPFEENQMNGNSMYGNTRELPSPTYLNPFNENQMNGSSMYGNTREIPGPAAYHNPFEENQLNQSSMHYNPFNENQMNQNSVYGNTRDLPGAAYLNPFEENQTNRSSIHHTSFNENQMSRNLMVGNTREQLDNDFFNPGEENLMSRSSMYGNAFEQLNDDFFNLGEENPMSQNDELQQSVEAPLVPLIQHNGELHQINDKQPNYEAPVLLFDGEVYETTHIVVEKKEISVEGVPYAPLEVVQQMNSSTAAADPEQNGSMWIVFNNVVYQKNTKIEPWEVADTVLRVTTARAPVDSAIEKLPRGFDLPEDARSKQKFIKPPTKNGAGGGAPVRWTADQKAYLFKLLELALRYVNRPLRYSDYGVITEALHRKFRGTENSPGVPYPIRGANNVHSKVWNSHQAEYKALERRVLREGRN
ncbi:hypothetical protein V8E51_016742 [Hyaloscypha variabilis]